MVIPLVSGSSSHIYAGWAGRICLRIFFLVCVCICLQSVSLMNLYPWKNCIQTGWDRIMWPRCFPVVYCEVVKCWKAFFESNYSQMALWPSRKVHLSRENVNPIAYCRVKKEKAFYLNWFYFIRHCTSSIDYFFPLYTYYFSGLSSRWESKNNGKVVKLDTLKHACEMSVVLISIFWAKRNVKIDFRKDMFFSLLF